MGRRAGSKRSRKNKRREKDKQRQEPEKETEAGKRQQTQATRHNEMDQPPRKVAGATPELSFGHRFGSRLERCTAATTVPPHASKKHVPWKRSLGKGNAGRQCARCTLAAGQVAHGTGRYRCGLVVSFSSVPEPCSALGQLSLNIATIKYQCSTQADPAQALHLLTHGIHRAPTAP